MVRGLSHTVVLLSLLAGCEGYRVAYVEHRVEAPCGEGACGAAQRQASLAAYAAFIAQAERQGVQIVVFPEYGITGFSSLPASSWHAGGYTESIPAPGAAAARIQDCASPLLPCVPPRTTVS